MPSHPRPVAGHPGGMIPILSVGQRIEDLMTIQWKAQAQKRAFYRTSDTLTAELGPWSAAALPVAPPYPFALDDQGYDILPLCPREDDTRWSFRRKIAKPTGYVRQITDHFLAHVFAREVQRSADLPPPLAALVEDADGIGTPLPRLLRQGGRKAFVEGRAFLLVDYQGPAAPSSAADQVGARHLLRVVPADDTLCIEQAVGNRILGAVVRLPTTEGWILWRIDGVNGQRVYPDEKGVLIKAIDAPLPHGYTACPLIPIGPMPGIIPAVAKAQQAICQTDSLLRIRNVGDSLPWLVVTGTANPTGFVNAMVQNPAFSAFEDPNAKATPIGADVSVADSLRKTMAADEEQLFQAAKVKPSQAATAQNPESGVAQAFRFVDADVELAEVALALEQAENEMWRVVAGAYGVEPPEATWPRTFVPLDRGEELNRLMLISASTLPPPIKEREYQRAAALLYPGDTDLQTELEQLPDQADPGNTPAPGDLGAAGAGGT